MFKNGTTVRRFFLAATAFGLASFGLAGAASANPVTTAVTVKAGLHIDARVALNTHDHRTQTVRWDRNRNPNEVIYRRALLRYDRNRNRIIDATERRGFWTYMAGTGVYGELSRDEQSRFGQLAYLFDGNRDGRLIGVEWRGMDKLIDSLRLFKNLDHNGDRSLTAYEVGFSALAPRFRVMDVNRDRRLSQQEVRDEVLRAYRNGEC